ncbi:Detected protein of confused Function [Hibiscus syriacus]|uniref:Detected protein of confused Function n=1 Tax=Hibiscus syriacus TaxID=106335 RepID=A0A6A2X7X2_HIBSY|nr:Detected protein of confused Function [Hibiscus syriacus]
MNSTRFLYSNGVVSYSSDVPSVGTFLKSLPDSELVFKANKKNPLLFPPLSITSSLKWETVIQSLVSNSLNQVLPIALEDRSIGEELAVTSLVFGDLEKRKAMDNVEKGAHLALVGRGRDISNAKYSDWVRLRKPLEKLRTPSVTEFLLSNNGDRILEGCITNFFVIC